MQVDDLIVVEGFTGVWWLHQNGLPHVVGTVGSDCSERQAELIVSLVKPNGRVWIAPDGDKFGEIFRGIHCRLISEGWIIKGGVFTPPPGYQPPKQSRPWKRRSDSKARSFGRIHILVIIDKGTGSTGHLLYHTDLSPHLL